MADYGTNGTAAALDSYLEDIEEMSLTSPQIEHQDIMARMRQEEERQQKVSNEEQTEQDKEEAEEANKGECNNGECLLEERKKNLRLFGEGDEAVGERKRTMLPRPSTAPSVSSSSQSRPSTAPAIAVNNRTSSSPIEDTMRGMQPVIECWSKSNCIYFFLVVGGLSLGSIPAGTF